MTPFAASHALDPRKGNGDAYASWSLGATSWLGLVADAPAAAAPGSGALLTRAVTEWLDLRGRECVGDFAAAGGGAVLLSEILSHCHRKMTRSESESEPGFWAAAVIALVAGGRLYVAGRGDCAAYVALRGGGIYRFSDSTQWEGGTLHPATAEAANLRVVHRAEGVYLGAGEPVFRADEAVTLDRSAVRRLLLVSDGCEEQVGSAGIAAALGSDDDSRFSKAAFEEMIEASELKDDTTFLGLSLAAPDRGPEEGLITPGLAATSETSYGFEADREPTGIGARGATVIVPGISGQEPGAKEPGPPPGLAKPSLLRRLFGVLFSCLAIAVLGFLVWKMVQFYLEETREDEGLPENSSIISPAESEKPD